MRNAMSIGEGSARVFVERPMSLGLIAVIVAVLALPRIWRLLQARRNRPALAHGGVEP
jgi:putative tricarboxylic transport membrane protein